VHHVTFRQEGPCALIARPAIGNGGSIDRNPENIDLGAKVETRKPLESHLEFMELIQSTCVN